MDTRREQIIDIVRREFIGPDPVEEEGCLQENGEEILTGDPPRVRYMAGILFPKEAKAENTDLRAEDVQAEEPEQEEGVEDTEDMLYDKLKERARQNMNIPRELFEKGQELVKAGKKAARIPLLASEVLEGMVKGKTKVRFELSGYEEPLNQIFHFLRYTVLTMVALVLFIGSCILCTTDFKPILPNGVPLLAVTGIVFSIALAIFSIKKLK
jgi:hypothetical protein